jgi:hypothetical protein
LVTARGHLFSLQVVDGRAVYESGVDGTHLVDQEKRPPPPNSTSGRKTAFD